jgi:hypothetical protein
MTTGDKGTDFGAVNGLPGFIAAAECRDANEPGGFRL